MLTDLFCSSIFLLIVFNLSFFKEVVSVCIDRNDQWSEFFYAAVPECLRHTKISPLGSYDLFYFPLPMITRTPVSFTNSYSNFSILILVVGPTDTISNLSFSSGRMIGPA